jgi:lysophospholipase L1-like esterase
VRLRTLRLLLLGAALLLGSAAGEFVLRWRCSGEALTRVLADAELHAPDPQRSYRLVPGASKGQTHINALGMRGAETAAARAPGRLRVLCVGDSITYGEAVADDADTYPAQLQAAFAAQGRPDVEVQNGGVMGYGSRQCARQLAELLPRTRPDLVLCCVGWNDVTFARLRGWHPAIDWITPCHAWAFDESYLVDYVLRHLLHWPRPADPRALELFEREVCGMIRLCEEQHVPLAFLDLPTVFAPVMSPAAVAKAARNLFEPREARSFLCFRTRWQNLAREHRVPLLFTGFEYEIPCSDKEPWLADVCHPTKDGYRRMVARLLPQLAPLLPPPTSTPSKARQSKTGPPKAAAPTNAPPAPRPASVPAQRSTATAPQPTRPGATGRGLATSVASPPVAGDVPGAGANKR